jgi:hypothetical protein
MKSETVIAILGQLYVVGGGGGGGDGDDDPFAMLFLPTSPITP